MSDERFKRTVIGLLAIAVGILAGNFAINYRRLEITERIERTLQIEIEEEK